MIERLKPYPEYRESGLAWLGRIPAHWQMRRMKLLLREVDSRSTNGTERLLKVSQYTGVTERKSSDSSGGQHTRASSLRGYKRVSVDDIVINIMLAWNGSLGVSRFSGIVSPAYCVYRFQANAMPWYYQEMLRLPVYKERIKAASTGVVDSRLRLYSDELGNLEAIQPPLEEQAAIVRFLNHATGKIDRFLRARRQGLALVRERLASETEQTLRSPLCRAIRISTAAELIYRPVDRQTGKMYTPIGLYNRGRGIFHKTPRDGSELGDSNFCWIEVGDIVLSGQFAWEGAVALARPQDGGCVASHRYPILRGRQCYVTSTFLLALLRTSYGTMILDHHSRGAAGRNRPLNVTTLLKEKVPIPPLSVQGSIAELVEHEHAIALAVEQAVRLLREFRTRLVADVVTGKLDVREAARHLPDDEEPLPEAGEADEDLGDETDLEEEDP